MFTEETVIDQIMVFEDGTLQVREATIITKDGNEVARTYHRYVILPDEDVTTRPEKVRNIADAARTEVAARGKR